MATTVTKNHFKSVSSVVQDIVSLVISMELDVYDDDMEELVQETHKKES